MDGTSKTPVGVLPEVKLILAHGRRAGRYPQQCCRLTPHRTSALRQEHVTRSIKRWHWEKCTLPQDFTTTSSVFKTPPGFYMYRLDECTNGRELDCRGERQRPTSPSIEKTFSHMRHRTNEHQNYGKPVEETSLSISNATLSLAATW